MWMSNGAALTGYYGKWSGKDVELDYYAPRHGKLKLVHDGPDSPGEGWIRSEFPDRFARGPVNWHREVPASEVSNIIIIEVTAKLFPLEAHLFAERGEDVAVEVRKAKPKASQELQEKYGMEVDDLGYVFGWVPRSDLTSLVAKIQQAPESPSAGSSDEVRVPA